ncbi:serine hydrolase [Novosphingobium sp.]|uniref:serine hydrolase domain-containing protein n=1 Tax=Novosphingobium sp. TaxID=1874826 RepID=UPI00261EDC36|nr:serine hydrolase [Novosphingobium sp.]
MSVRLWHAVLSASVALAPVVASAQTVPAGPSAAVISMREQWLNPAVNSFTFRDTNKVFESRDVPRSGPVWPLVTGPALAMPQHQSSAGSMGYNAWADRTFTNALLVMKDGKVVFEDYRNKSDAATHFISFSMAKTFTALLVGIALGEGKIHSLDDKAGDYVPELKTGGYGDATIRQILQMRSGVDYEERYDFGEHPSLAATIHTKAIVRNQMRFADPAVTIGKKTAPGSTFNYATLDTAVLGWILERATGEKLETYTASRLWGPLGAEAGAFWMADGPPGNGRALNGMGYNAVLRDFARIGQMMLDGGKVGDSQVIPAGWVKEMTTMIPFPAEYARKAEFKGYGYQTWQVDNEPGAYSAVGLAGQFIYVHPATRTVIVKLSYNPPVEPEWLTGEVIDYFHAIARAPAPK